MHNGRSGQALCCLAKVSPNLLYKFMALTSEPLFRNSGIFHLSIIPLSGLYPTGIPVFKQLQGQEGHLPFQCFPLYPGPNIGPLHLRKISCKSSLVSTGPVKNSELHTVKEYVWYHFQIKLEFNFLLLIFLLFLKISLIIT